MKIKHRGIYHDRLDAPFVGSLLFALDCHHGCPGCCHDGRRETPYYENTAEEMIQEVLDYKFSEGIILGGYEWSEQLDDMLALIKEAIVHNLKLIVYTHHTEEEFEQLVPQLYQYKGVYVKYGEYRENESSPSHFSYGVPLASTNQYIKLIE